MEKSTAKRSSSNILIFLILLTITLLVYVPGLNQLGFYRDDWNNMFNAYTQGADMLIPHYASDRPVDGYLLRTAYELFGANLLPYLIINLICRFLCGVLFYLSLMLIWRKHKFPAFVAAALFLIFPGFLRPGGWVCLFAASNCHAEYSAFNLSFTPGAASGENGVEDRARTHFNNARERGNGVDGILYWHGGAALPALLCLALQSFGG